ncbi:MAG: hypothetical protein PHH51_00920 [Bacilli bacterium]|nr:hypothetical protein [Bacilli bacterium]MDD3896054.1 hypothetical protein [Bacilli bacterium]MDD4407889.1 hypothetical protein [Bacilli bacterium]
MEKTKLNYLIYFIIALGTIILFVSAYKAEKIHEEKLMLVINNKIKEAAKECYLKKECVNNIKLQDLYDKKYIEEVINPVSKEVMDSKLCLEYKNEKIIFCD